MTKQTTKTKDGIYTRKGRSGFWISWVDAQGRRRRRKTDSQNITQAKQARASELLRAEQAKTLGFAPPGEETFAEVGDRYLAYQKARLTPKAYEREEIIMRLYLKPFFTGKLSTIRRGDIQHYVTSRIGKAKASPYSIQKEVNVIKHLFRLAVEWEIIPYSPAQGIKGVKVPAGRVRYLQPTELKVLIEAAPLWIRPIIALAVSTGMRRGEIIGLRRLDVDLVHSRIMLPQTKNGDGRIVYLNQSAQAIMCQLLSSEHVASTDRIFSDIKPDKVTTAFRRACVKAEIFDFRFHDLRHTAASWLRMSGADIHTVAQLLGHKDLRMAARYQHLSPAFLADAVNRLDGIFGDLSHQSVTNEKALTSGEPVSASD